VLFDLFLRSADGFRRDAPGYRTDVMEDGYPLRKLLPPRHLSHQARDGERLATTEITLAGEPLRELRLVLK
jgi:hypothetical protein